jgi:lipid-binding SYLF domain-containing protein
MDRGRRALCLALLSTLAITGAVPKTEAASAAAIDDDVDATLSQFYRHVEGSYQLVRKATGILVFPTIIKAGIGIGGEYGEGALRIRGRTVAYFNTISACRRGPSSYCS